jgi:hypothetical protein
LIMILFITGCSKTYETVTITVDLGGSISDYIKKYIKWEKEDKRVIIDGECDSSCTLMIGIINRDHICVTERASFQFHAAGFSDGMGRSIMNKWGDRILSPSGTQLMMDFYSPDVVEWIGKKGGLNDNLIVLDGDEMNKMFKRCP